MIDFNTRNFDKLSVNQLRRITDYWLRQYLLNTTPKKYGKYKCPIKGKYFDPGRMHVAHFIDRGVSSTRYDLDNVHLISSDSNTFDAQIPSEGYKSKHHKDYEEFLGEEKTAQLLNKSKEILVRTREDYIKLIEKFKNESI